MKKVVVYGGTRNFYPLMDTALKSLLANNRIDQVYFLIEDDEFPTWLPACVKCINVSGQTWFDKNGPNYSSQVTFMTLMRNAMTQLLPDEKRVLWLDVDTIVDGDISELFTMDMTEYCYGAAIEMEKSTDFFRYHNIGVLLINLEKIRELKLDGPMIRYLNTHKLQYPDQDVINLMFQPWIKTISSAYNSTVFTPWCDIRKIVHYAGISKWDNFGLWQMYSSLSWEGIKA